jgi:hypothetical protein
MVRVLRGAAAPLMALALLALFAGRGNAQYVVAPAPVVTYSPPVVSYSYTPAVRYYAPVPVVTYSPPVVAYSPPVVAYSPAVAYPATTVTTYRPYALLPRRRVTVTTYAPSYRYYPTYAYYR